MITIEKFYTKEDITATIKTEKNFSIFFLMHIFQIPQMLSYNPLIIIIIYQ